MSYGTTQWSKITVASGAAVVLTVGIAGISLKNWSVTSMTCRFLCVERCSEPRIVVDTKFNSLEAKKIWSGRFRLQRVSFLTLLLQAYTVE